MAWGCLCYRRRLSFHVGREKAQKQLKYFVIYL
jgi:hypothetical protein